MQGHPPQGYPPPGYGPAPAYGALPGQPMPMAYPPAMPFGSAYPTAPLMQPPLWTLPFGISNENDNECRCCWHLPCDICCCSRMLWYRDAMMEGVRWMPNPHGEGAQPLNHNACCCFGWTHDGVAYGQPVSYEAFPKLCGVLMPCLGDGEEILVRERGREVGKVVSLQPCVCCCKNMPTGEAFDMQGRSVFFKEETVYCCGFTMAGMQAEGACCSCSCWQSASAEIKSRRHVLYGSPMAPSPHGVPIGRIYMRRHLCYWCFPSWVGFQDQWPQTNPPLSPDDYRLLLGMVHQWRWKIENQQRWTMGLDLLELFCRCLCQSGNG